MRVQPRVIVNYNQAMKTVLLLFGLATCVSCGGGGGSAPASSTPNSYAGVYSGTFFATGLDDGQMIIDVANNGVATGTVGSSALNEDGSLVGTVSNSGVANSRVSFPGYGVGAIYSTVSVTGGVLTGTGTESWRGKSYPISYTLTAQQTGHRQ